MNIKDLFTEDGVNETIKRIEKLSAESVPQWGKMKVEEMLAHCNVAYEMVFKEGKYKKPNGFAKLMLKLFVKKAVVGPKPYPKNGRTSPDFLIKDERNFEVEKNKLISYIIKVNKLGKDHFNQKESHSFGKLNTTEWNTLFSKHLDHHLTQFGV